MATGSDGLAGCILVPLSLTAVSEVKLAVACHQARALRAALLLLHVIPAHAFDPTAVSPTEAMARASLDAAVARLRAEGVVAEALLRRGSTAPVILEEARERRASLVVIGSSTRARVPRTLLGSVADAVIHDAPCPVLLVRPTFEPDAGRSLLHLDPSDLLVPLARGQRVVDLARIVGSATRAHELGPDFRPLRSTPADEQRFQSILAALVRGEILPPVELYQLGFGYYVRDGHHRVASARQLGWSEITANVLQLVPLADAQAERVVRARQAFEQATGLTRIGAARPESYDQLLALIDAYQEEAGLAEQSEAARRWYEEVFRPLWRRVREVGLTQHFPGERAADVIARLAAWRAAEAARTGEPPSWEEALERLGAASS